MICQSRFAVISGIRLPIVLEEKVDQLVNLERCDVDGIDHVSKLVQIVWIDIQ